MFYLALLLVIVGVAGISATEFKISVTKEDSLFNVVGTNFYLDISSCHENKPIHGVLDRYVKYITLEKQLSNKIDSKKYSIRNVYEKQTLPKGAINSSGRKAEDIFFPIDNRKLIDYCKGRR